MSRNNVYYSPESYGLTAFGDAERDDLSYEFDMFVVWTNEAGEFFWAEDAGCSCPSPFEDVSSVDQLCRGTARDALNDLDAWVDGYSGYSRSARERGATSLRAALEAVTA